MEGAVAFIMEATRVLAATVASLLPDAAAEKPYDWEAHNLVKNVYAHRRTINALDERLSRLDVPVDDEGLLEDLVSCEQCDTRLPRAAASSDDEGCYFCGACSYTLGVEDLAAVRSERDAAIARAEKAEAEVWRAAEARCLQPNELASLRAELAHFKSETERARAGRADAEKRVAELEAECASISEEFGLPPTIRPANGEIARLLERDRHRIATLESSLAVAEKDRCECRFADGEWYEKCSFHGEQHDELVKAEEHACPDGVAFYGDLMKYGEQAFAAGRASVDVASVSGAATK